MLAEPEKDWQETCLTEERDRNHHAPSTTDYVAQSSVDGCECTVSSDGVIP